MVSGCLSKLPMIIANGYFIDSGSQSRKCLEMFFLPTANGRKISITQPCTKYLPAREYISII